MDTEQKFIEKIAEELLKDMGLDGKVVVTDSEGKFSVNIKGEDLGILIGYHGETLNAFQLILSMIVYRKTDKWVKILVDIGDYRQEREGKLREIAESSAQKARFLQKSVELKPMNPYERMIIHSAVSTIEGVKSESAGEGKDRHVIISPA